MEPTFTALGAVAGLCVAIVLVLLRMLPAYSLMVGALVGAPGSRFAVAAVAVFLFRSA